MFMVTPKMALVRAENTNKISHSLVRKMIDHGYISNEKYLYSLLDGKKKKNKAMIVRPNVDNIIPMWRHMRVN